MLVVKALGTALRPPDGGALLAQSCIADPPMNATFPLECIAVSPSEGRYRIIYNITRAGEYSMDIFLDGQLAGGRPQAPVTITQGPSSELGSGVANDVVNSSMAGVQDSILVLVRDEFGNQRPTGGDSLVVRIKTIETAAAATQV